MGSYKHIETCIGEYIAKHYTDAIQVGIREKHGGSTHPPHAGTRVRCVLMSKTREVPEWLYFTSDDIFSPDISPV